MSQRRYMKAFLYKMPYHIFNFRQHPELYRTNKSKQIAYYINPYKTELAPLFRFSTPEKARKASKQIYEKFLEYRNRGDFVGCDVAKKFVQLGQERSRMYAMYQHGKRWQTLADGTMIKQQKRQIEDRIKAESAGVFAEVLQQINSDEEYKKLQSLHEEKYGGQEADWSSVDLTDDAKAELAHWEQERKQSANNMFTARKRKSLIYF